MASTFERIEKIFKSLLEDRDLNLSDEEAAGMAGAIAVESPRVSPTQRQWGGGPGRGLFQHEIETQVKNKAGQKRDKGEDMFHERRGEDLKKKYLNTSYKGPKLTTSISGEESRLHRRTDESNYRKAELQAAAKGDSILKQQLEFALDELKNIPYEKNRFEKARKKSKTPEEMAVNFTKANLRPGKPHYKKRKKMAKEIYRKLILDRIRSKKEFKPASPMQEELKWREQLKDNSIRKRLFNNPQDLL